MPAGLPSKSSIRTRRAFMQCFSSAQRSDVLRDEVRVHVDEYVRDGRLGCPSMDVWTGRRDECGAGVNRERKRHGSRLREQVSRGFASLCGGTPAEVERNGSCCVGCPFPYIKKSAVAEGSAWFCSFCEASLVRGHRIIQAERRGSEKVLQTRFPRKRRAGNTRRAICLPLRE